jgi:hypothetical protein
MTLKQNQRKPFQTQEAEQLLRLGKLRTKV